MRNSVTAAERPQSCQPRCQQCTAAQLYVSAHVDLLMRRDAQAFMAPQECCCAAMLRAATFCAGAMAMMLRGE